MVGRSSEDPQVRTQSSLQTTDIPLWEQRWTMRFQILTAFLIYYAYDFTMEHSWPAGQKGGT